MVPRFITNALAGEHIEVYGGDQILDLLHISDAIDGIVRAIMLLERMTCHGYYDVFNLATGAPHSLNDVISLVSLYVGRDIDTVRLEPRSFDVKRYIGDTKKASEKLGFVARMTLEEGIPATIDLYKTCMYELGHKSLTSTSHEGLVYRGAVN
jgi:nucleoside-diphosphate-sugar epimerase